MRILVVDDAVGIRRGLGAFLLRAGYECDFAANGIEGLRFGLKSAYDLVLSDIEMPLMDGLKFITRLRMGGPNMKTPILVFSSHQREESVLMAAKLGIEGYILKPTNEAAMTEAVRTIFRVIQRTERAAERAAARAWSSS